MIFRIGAGLLAARYHVRVKRRRLWLLVASLLLFTCVMVMYGKQIDAAVHRHEVQRVYRFPRLAASKESGAWIMSDLQLRRPRHAGSVSGVWSGDGGTGEELIRSPRLVYSGYHFILS